MTPAGHKIIRGRPSALTLSALLWLAGVAQAEMRCNVETAADVTRIVVELDVPHADNMLLVTPEGRRIYLRDVDTPTQHPSVSDFRNVASFVLDSSTRGTWFNDWGETEVVAAIGATGTYELLVAKDLENEMQRPDSARCTFEL